MVKYNNIKTLSLFLGATLLIAGILLPSQALASIPQFQPLKLRDMTSQEKQTLNGDLAAEFKLLDRDLKLQFADLMKKVSLMGFYKNEKSARGI